MGITVAKAYANNEVALIAWAVDGKIDGCLGFEVVRVHLDTGEVRPLPAWVPFKGQSNDDWKPHTTSEWPVQKFMWRDLTLRKRRNSTDRRPIDFEVKYRVRPVGKRRPGLEPVPDADGANGGPALAYLQPAVETNVVRVTDKCGDIRAAFTNGILAAQWLSNALKTKLGDKPDANDLKAAISKQGDPIRTYLAGDVLDFLKTPLTKSQQPAKLALYELDDKELLDDLVADAARIDLILSNTGMSKTSKTWDGENESARKRLAAARAQLQNRMFNNSNHIGHNKFVVVPGEDLVLTGSTNWTPNGLCAQTNNALLIQSRDVAGAYAQYWSQLHADRATMKDPRPLTKTANNVQGPAFRSWNKDHSFKIDLDGGKTGLEIWYSPNTHQGIKKADSPLPPDLSVVYAAMRQAKQAILFLVFLPGGEGKQSIIEEAIKVGEEEKELLVLGAVSSPLAMPNYHPTRGAGATSAALYSTGRAAAAHTKAARQPAAKKKRAGQAKPPQPHVFVDGNTMIIRASALGTDDLVGAFERQELLSAGNAIIHDKIVVVDPLSPNCVVVTGSHNLGYKASYGNDENLLIIRGNQALAQAYAVHVLDVYDHYRFRALQADRHQKGEGTFTGFLSTQDNWQDPYLRNTKGREARYFASGKPD